MQIVYLRRAAKEYLWFRDYYTRIFPEGRDKAFTHYFKVLSLIVSHPEIGKPEGKPPRRRFKISNTPFSISYKVLGNRMEIVRIRDNRSEDTEDMDTE
jgi:plasmid stabilization system protein ParE